VLHLAGSIFWGVQFLPLDGVSAFFDIGSG
jgi:hypothetical protein